MLTTGKILVIAGQRHLSSALWGFSFWVIAFSWTFLLDVKTLSSNILLKSEGIRESSQKFLLCYQYVFHVWSLLEGFKSFIKICFLHGFFPMFVSYHFGPGWSSGWSIGVRRSFLIIFLFVLDISWKTSLIKNLFWLRYFLRNLSLLSIGLRIGVVIRGFLSACGNLFLAMYVKQNLKGCVAWALLSKSGDWVGCYAKYLIFKDTSWTEILHIVAEFRLTVLHGKTGLPA